MRIEHTHGTASDVNPAPSGKGVEFRLGEYRVQLPGDLADRVTAGDRVAVAGARRDDTFYADAVHNYSQRRVTQRDVTLIILALGACAFTILFCAVQGYHLLAQGRNNAATTMGLISLAGVVGVMLSLSRLRAIIKAGSRIRYLEP